MIKINGVLYENATTTIAIDGSMSIIFETVESLDDFEQRFIDGSTIEIIENGSTIAIYYDKELKSISLIKGTPRKVKVVLVVTPVKDTVEQELRELSEIQEEAITDLAGTVSDMSEDAEVTAEAFEELAEIVSDLVERVSALEATNITTESEGIE